MSQLAQRLCFDLSNAFARDVEVLANFFERPLVTAIVEAESQTNHTLFTWAQGLQHVAGELTHQLARSVLELVDDFDHVHRNADGARLIGDCSRDCLANPPRRIS